MLNYFLKLYTSFLTITCLIVTIASFHLVAFAGNLPEKTIAQSSDKFNHQRLKKTVNVCSAKDRSQNSNPAPSLVGTDGDYTVTTSNVVLNNYAILAADAAVADTAIEVTNAADLDSSITQLGTLAAGDLLMIIQMQGASIDTSNSVSYGAVTAINSAGLYEFVTVASISNNVITLDTTSGCGALRNAYSAAGRTQIIRVPQFNNLTVDAGASVTASSWDGQRGGVVALQTAATLTLNGTISADAAGFRGGALDNNATLNIADYVSTSSGDGAEKGEGIAGSGAQYDLLSGRYGRGAAANGGGGGNAHNAGGGGGANGNNANSWNGQGVMSNSVVGSGAWSLDPGYVANGNALTNSSGGGRAGYTFSQSNQNALALAPGQSAWTGDLRYERGGLGGRPVDNNPASRLFLGGGGGAGDANDSSGGAGGNGGGLVFVFGNTITGTGDITANGQNGNNTVGFGNDAPGGGGAGGTVVASANTLSGISVTANGGAGGNQFISTDEAEGPGGGGGGGYIAIIGGIVTRTALGGQGGITTSAALTEFPRNGATDGADGVANATISSLPICNLTATSSQIRISGRVMTSFGRGISKAFITITDSHGDVRYALTNPFGYYNFTAVPAGQAYILSVSDKRYHFDNPSQVLTASADREDVNFVAQP